MTRIARPLNWKARIWMTVIDGGANHQLFEARVWESVRLARLSQGHHKGTRVTSATTLMYSHGRGARGAVAGLDIGRRVVTHVAQTGKTKRLPMLIPLIIHILPYRPHPTDPCLCNPASTRSPPPLVIIPLRSVIVLPTSSTSIVHPLVCWAAPRSSNVASSSSNDAPSRSRGRGT